jgi:two-component system, NtrC family, response regulator
VRILVVDDSRDFAEIFTRLLEQRGHNAEAVYSGEDAIKRFRNEKFSLAFVDFKLPGINGLDCLYAIKQLDPACRIVMMSGYKMKKIHPDSHEEDYRVIYKPFDMDKVMEFLN